MTSLPDDVLYDIFHRITVDAQSRSRNHGGVMTEPLFSSHVCRRWRQVALSRRTLWSYLCIDDFCGRRRRERMLEIFHAWFERTGKAPLNFSISFKLRCGEDIEGHRKMESVVKSLVAEQQRWKDVSFGWKFKASSEFTIKLTDMPLLSSIALYNGMLTYDGVEIVPHIGIARSQQLEYMGLDGGYTIEFGEDPVHSLRRVVRTITNMPGVVEVAEHCLAILRACPNLTDFRAYTFIQSGILIPDQTFSTNCFVHNVGTLALGSPNGHLTALVMDKLTLPELKHLKFQTFQTRFESLNLLRNIIERSRPRLEKLQIQEYDATPDELLPVLRMLPTLET